MINFLIGFILFIIGLVIGLAIGDIRSGDTRKKLRVAENIIRELRRSRSERQRHEEEFPIIPSQRKHGL